MWLRRSGARGKLTREPELRIAFRLAALLGCTVAELGQRMSAHEFGQWAAFLAREPIAAPLDLWAAQMALLANGPLVKRGKGLWSAADFHPDPWQPAEPQPQFKSTAAELRHMLRHMRRR